MKKFLSVLSLVLAVIILLTGCGGSSPLSGQTQAETGELVLYLPPYTPDWLSAAVSDFRRTYGNVHITVRDFSQGDFKENCKVYQEQVTNELAAGEGPDIIFPDYLGADLSKAMLSHAFLDVAPFLQEDPSFSTDDYLPGVFCGGTIENSQYIIPLSVQMPIFLSSTQMLREIGIDSVNTGDTASFLRQIGEALPQAGQKQGFQRMISMQNFFGVFLECADLPLMDYQTKQVCGNEEKIRDFFEAYKLYYPNDYVEGGMRYRLGEGYKYLLSNQYYFDKISDLPDLMYAASILNADGGYSLSVLHDMDGGTAVIYYFMAAVRSNSPNQVNACRFIRLLLSEHYQSMMSQEGIPVHKAAIEKILTKEWERCASQVISKDKAYALEAPSEEEVRQMLDELYSVNSGSLPIMNIEEMIWESMHPFFKGETSYESCYAGLQSKLRLYMDE